MTAFFAKWQAAKGAFAPSVTRAAPIARIAPDSAARRAADEAIECINCAVCYAACDTVRWNPAYLGPAALNRAWTLLNDERNAAIPERLAVIAAGGGCYACHSHQSCQEHCPVGLNPTASIAGLKRRAMAAYLKGEIGS
jgi:fumarate reductase iron-sulfur subunit